MQHGIFSSLATTARRWRYGLVCAALLGSAGAALAQQELRVLTHGAFALPKPLLAQFEKEQHIKLRITKAGDAGEMLNKLILTRANPIADVVYGLDNALVPKAMAAGVLAPYPPAPAKESKLGNTLPALTTAFGQASAYVLPVDYGYVTVNYDKAWFAKKGLALPQSLDDLTQPAYAQLLVTQNPATSSPGYAFLLATIGTLGEEKAFDWWARMRANGLKVAKGWTEAYYTEFSRNGGKQPLVVSYASSPAAELFYAKDKPSTPPTGSLALGGAVYRQVEGVALVQGGKAEQAALQWIAFMRSAAVQQSLQTEMWMFPAVAGVARDAVMQHAPEPSQFAQPSEADITAKGADWVARWTRVVLR